MRVFNFDLRRFKTITNTTHETLITGTSAADSILNHGFKVTISTGNGDDTVSNIWNIDYTDDDNNFYSSDYVSINTGAGNDLIYNDRGFYCTINTGEGNDSVYSQLFFDHCTINTGKGNDLINLSSKTYDEDEYNSEKNVIIYKAGDGNDKIYGFDDDDTLSISGGSYSTKKSGSDIIVTVDDGKISLIGAASLSAVNIDGEETPIETNSWTLKGTTATYGTTSKTLVTVKGVKSTDGLSLKNKIVTVSNSSLNQKKVTVNNGYTLKLGDDVTKSTSKAVGWTKSGSTATYKTASTTAGYKLTNNQISYVKKSGGATLATVKGSAGKDVFIYSSGNGKITDFGTTDTLRIGDGNGTYSSETSGKNLIVTVGNNKLTLVGAANLKSPNIAGTKKTESKGIVVDGKKVTLTEDYAEENFTFADSNSMLTVDASAVALDINITGNKFMNSILGGAGNDTLAGAKGNDTLDGGDGADIFIYKAGDGNDTIVNYAEEDKISIASGTVDKISSNNKDVILTVGNGKITVKDAVNKIVTFVEKGKTIGYYNAVMIEGKVATLTDDYTAQTFTAKDKFKSIRTINADAVTHNLKITGSNGGDFIIGGKGKNTLIGGGGSDTLQGGKDTDVFVYDSGNDVIESYTAGDVISVKGAVSDAVEYNGDDVIFSVNNSGTITVTEGKGKKIKLIDKNGSTNKIYNGADMWFIEDDTNFDTDNQLGSIIKRSAAYPFDTPTDLTSLIQKNNFITYNGKK